MDAGHNQPPSLVEFAVQSADELSNWLKEHPVVETEEHSREAKTLYDRASDCLKDMEKERKDRGKPLREQIDLINGEYRSPTAILEKIRLELLGRLDVWRREEQKRRNKELEEARQRQAELEQRAREAEAREQAAKEDAALGTEVDLAAITRDADAAFSEFQAGARTTARLEMAKDVKARGGHRPAIGESRFDQKLRPTDLVVVDPYKALSVMGWSERLLEALKSDARAFKREIGYWPDGIKEEIK